MSEAQRKKSPRAPTMALDEALERALRAYERERLHPAPTEVFAQNIGYKSANNGSALQAIASLRYLGLVERPKDGQLAVTKEVEAYKFAPDETIRKSLLIGFLKAPPLYAELLERFQSGLPSDANLRYELIQRGFLPQTAESASQAFRRSVAFVGYFDQVREAQIELAPNEAIPPEMSHQSENATVASASQRASNVDVAEHDGQLDNIPVRLPGGRRAWLVVPTPFYESDKTRLKAQIDLLLTQDEEDDWRR